MTYSVLKVPLNPNQPTNQPWPQLELLGNSWSGCGILYVMLLHDTHYIIMWPATS